MSDALPTREEIAEIITDRWLESSDPGEVDALELADALLARLRPAWEDLTGRLMVATDWNNRSFREYEAEMKIQLDKYAALRADLARLREDHADDIENLKQALADTGDAIAAKNALRLDLRACAEAIAGVVELRKLAKRDSQHDAGLESAIDDLPNILASPGVRAVMTDK